MRRISRTGYILKFLSILIILLLTTTVLTGCDLDIFSDNNDGSGNLRDKFPGLAVSDLVDAYYNAIENDIDYGLYGDISRAELLKSTLHPVQDIEVSRQFSEQKFYNKNIESNFSDDRETYAESYKEYFQLIGERTNEVLRGKEIDDDIDEEELISIDDDTAEYVAPVQKEPSGAEEFSYIVIMEIEELDSEWYIHSISKEEAEFDND